MTLPVFIVTKAKRRGYVRVECPRCKNVLWLNRRVWLRSSEYKTRPCTFCWKPSWLRAADKAAKERS